MLVTLAIFVVLLLALSGLMIASGWMINEKAGQPGWAAIVPFYGAYVLIVHVCYLPAIWFWLLLVPVVDIFVALALMVVIPLTLAKRFGKDTVFGLGLLFLGMVFYPMLAFGDAEHDSQTRGGRSRGRDYRDYEDEDEDEDDRPRRKARDEYDDEDDRPAPRRRRRDDDD